MNPYKVACLVTTTLLVASVALHLTHPSDAPASTDAAPRNASAAAGETASSRLDAESADADPHLFQPGSAAEHLEQELSRCRRSTWSIASRILEESCPDTADEAATSNGPLGDVAREHLRKHWNDKRDEIIDSLQPLGTPEAVAKDVEKKLADHRARFELTSSEEEELRRGYEALWAAHGDALQALVADEDWEGAMDEARAFWADEDAMLTGALGPDRLDLYRAADGPSRTVILAILATLGELPWNDDTLEW